MGLLPKDIERMIMNEDLDRDWKEMQVRDMMAYIGGHKNEVMKLST